MIDKDEVLRRIDPIVFYAEHLGGPLLGAGRQRKARCPFHLDEDPSLSVDTTTGLFFCHGCGEKGGLVDYVMKTKTVDFKEALSYLDTWAGGGSSSSTARRSAAENTAQGKRTPGASSKTTGASERSYTLREIEERILRGGYRFTRIHHYIGGTPPYAKAIFKNSQGEKIARFFSLIDPAAGLFVDKRQSAPVLYNAAALDSAGESDTVFYCEGEKDCDVLASLGFVATTGGGVNEWRDSFAEKLRGRHVVILPDCDEPGRTLARKVAASLRAVASSVKIVALPDLPEKGDISDYVEERRASGKTDDAIGAELRVLIDATPAEIPDEDQDADPGWLPVPGNWGYFVDGAGFLCRTYARGENITTVRLSNFDGAIVEEINEDDGSGITKRAYVLEGRRGKKNLPPLEVPVKQFDAMSWHRGWSGAILEAGTRCKDSSRHAIETRNPARRERHVFTHTGWRQIRGAWAFLTATGGIGANDVEVRLPEDLQKYSVPNRSPASELQAIQASLEFLTLAHDTITIPVWLSAFLAPLVSFILPQFVVFLYGDPDSMKTSLACLAAAHFGEDLKHKAGLMNFSDTPASVQYRLFCLKDTLAVCDDYHPTGNKFDQEKMHQLLQNIIRGTANRTGRARMSADSTPQTRYYPRGMVLLTGERLPMIKSTRIRTVTVEVKQGDVDLARLSSLHERAGLLPHAMSSYVGWLRENLSEIERRGRQDVEKLRTVAYQGGGLKQAEHIAFMQYALSIVCNWLSDRGAITKSEMEDLSSRSWRALAGIAEEQAQLIDEEDPVRKFTEILTGMLFQGTVRIESKIDGLACMGHVNGRLIGYYDREWLFLLPEPLWRELEVRCGEVGTRFPVDATSLFKTLRNRGISKCDSGHTTIKFRAPRTGETLRVLKILRHSLSTKAGTPGTNEENEE